ncbi:MAG: methyl-accepting chemotaxis protein, partial [Gemmatimonadaceae bacterium]
MMRFSFSRAAASKTPKVDPSPLRQEISRLGSEAAVVAAACSSIADAHRKQVELIDAGIASATEIAQSIRGLGSADQVESGKPSLSNVVEQATQLTTSTTRVSDTVGAMARSTLDLSNEADGAGTAIAQVATTVEKLTQSAGAALRMAEESVGAVERTSQFIAGVVASTQHAAANAESNAAAVAKLAGAVDDVSRSANDVAQRANGAATSMDDVATRVADTERAMSAVAQLARERGEAPHGPAAADIDVVVDAVNSIAERINLLSLNAAIEAAHAGDAGRGFVIIAEELRNLSER